MRALLIGRFQPFHKGHLNLVKRILQEEGELIIGISSAQFNYFNKDPFTAGERIFMIHEALKEEGIDLSRCCIIPLLNDPNNARWAAHVKSFTPPFDVVYSGNPLVTKLFQDVGVRVKAPEFYDRDRYSSSHIRELMLKGEDWEDLVPKAVAKVIYELKGEERMKMVTTTETMPLLW